MKDLRRTEFLDAQACKPLTHVNGDLDRLALNKTSDETTSEGITCTVGVVDLLVSDGVNGELLDIRLSLDSDKGGKRALGDNGDTLTLAVLLGKVGKVAADVLGLLGGQVVRLSVGGSLGLVANDVVLVRSASINDILEELGDERS